jgi:hypothetical protein
MMDGACASGHPNLALHHRPARQRQQTGRRGGIGQLMMSKEKRRQRQRRLLSGDMGLSAS